MAAVPSMAAAIAASLPAPQTAPTPAAPSYEAIPASMSKVIDIEADIPLSYIQLDGLVSVLPSLCYNMRRLKGIALPCLNRCFASQFFKVAGETC